MKLKILFFFTNIFLLISIVHNKSSKDTVTGDFIRVWGDNDHSQLSLWSTYYTHAQLFRKTEGFEDDSFRRVCCLLDNIMILTSTNKIFSLGLNREISWPYEYYGLLGHLNIGINETDIPVLVMDESNSNNPIVDMFCALRNVLIRKTDGNVFGIGHNKHNLLNQGHSNTIDEFTSVLNFDLSGLKVKKMWMADMGNNNPSIVHSCLDKMIFLSDDGRLFIHSNNDSSCDQWIFGNENLLTNELKPQKKNFTDDFLNEHKITKFFASLHFIFAIFDNNDIWGIGVPYFFGEGTTPYECYILNNFESRPIDFFNSKSGVSHLKGRQILDMQCMDGGESRCPDHGWRNNMFCFALFDDYWVYSWGAMPGGYTLDTKSRFAGRNLTLESDMSRAFPIDQGEIPFSSKIVQIDVRLYSVFYLLENGMLFGTGEEYWREYSFEYEFDNAMYPRRILSAVDDISWIGQSRGSMSNVLLSTSFKCDGKIPTSPTACDEYSICIGEDYCKYEESWLQPYMILLFIFVPIITILAILFILFFCGGFILCMRNVHVMNIDDTDVELRKMEKKMEKKVLKEVKVKKEIFNIKYGQLKVLKCFEKGGRNSVVYHCIYKKKEVAFKCFKCNEIFINKEAYENFENEISSYKNLSHKNIAKHYGSVMQKPKVGVVNELGTLGNLKYVLTSQTPELTKGQKVKICHEIASALEYLHECEIVHGNLKLENIILFEDIEEIEKKKKKVRKNFLDKDLDIKVIAKLVDYGFLKSLEKLPKNKQSIIYNAPELLKGNDANEKSDMWAFAICIFQIFSNDITPYGKVPLESVEFKVCKDPSFRPDMTRISSAWVAEFIRKALSDDPDERPTFKETKELFFDYIPKRASTTDLVNKIKKLAEWEKQRGEKEEQKLLKEEKAEKKEEVEEVEEV